METKHYLQLELEELLQSGPTMWTFLQRGSLDGVWYWDLERPDQEWMSPEMWRLLGVDPSTKRHDPAEWQDLINQEDLKLALENFNRHCADPNHPYDQTVRYRHANGSTVWVRCRGIAIRDDTGKPIRMLGAHNDLTAVKLAEQKALQDKVAIESANSDLQSFAYSISHDMKAPVNTLTVLLNELREHLEQHGDQEGLSLTAHATDVTERMGRLIDDVLSYTNVVGESATLEPVSLDECVAAAIDDLRASISDVAATINVESLPRINGHKTQMHLLFQNLIGNALKFHRPDVPPVITIASRRRPEDNAIELSVQDNGIGIEPNHLDRIFTMFERLHRRSEYAGNGLGLALCRRVAVNHGGSLSVESKPGQGSTFTVCLPEAIQ